MKKVICAVRGMSCAACSSAVEKCLVAIDGIENVSVNLATDEASFEYAETLSEQNIKEMVKKAGYELIFPSSISSDSNDSEESRTERNSKIRLYLSVVFAAMLLLFTMGRMIFSQIPMINGYVQLFLCFPVLICGLRFFSRGFYLLLKGHPNMDSLVAVGSSASFLYSLYNLISGISSHYYFDGVATIITLVMVGKYVELRSRHKAGESIRTLMQFAPSKATVIVDGQQIEKVVENIQKGDMILVHPGEKIAVDGIVLSDECYVNQSMLTGESLPVQKKSGDMVYAATLNTNISFIFRATNVGADTIFSSIVKMVKEAQTSKPPIARIADKVASVFVPTVISVAIVVFCLWFFTGHGFAVALTNAVGVLVVACPCSLGLATPIAVVTATGKAASFGVLFRNAQALEQLGKMKNVMFDKTGTLTSGKPEVVGYSSDETLYLAALAEQGSEHPYAKAVLRAYKKEPEIVKYTTAVPGMGIIARFNGKKIIAGNKLLMKENDIEICSEEPEAQIYVAENDRYVGYIAIKDTIREEAKSAVEQLENLNLRCCMLTGDKEEQAKEIAGICGLSGFYSSLMPEDKLRMIEKTELSVMVGDGINDAPSLEKADIGIAMGNGTDVAISCADVVVVRDNLLAIPLAVRLSRATLRNIKISLFFAFFYNIMAIPVASGVLTLFGGTALNPMICALCMSLSSICVVFNALRLRNFS